MTAVEVLESIGYGPESEVSVDETLLLGVDIHSTANTYKARQLVRRGVSGEPSFSCERWLRLHFQLTDAKVTLVRFWIPNLAPNSEWDLLMGATFDYRKPRAIPSDVAINNVPVADPGAAQPNVYPVAQDTLGFVDLDDQLNSQLGEYSPWLVLQAVWLGGSNEPFQSAPLQLRFAWEQEGS